MSTTAKVPRKGERYIVHTGFVAGVLITWQAPFTSGDEKALPVGLQFVIEIEPPPGATAAVALPDPYVEWERKLVNQEDWGADKYGGYYLSIPFDLIAANCSVVSHPPT